MKKSILQLLHYRLKHFYNNFMGKTYLIKNIVFEHLFKYNLKLRFTQWFEFLEKYAYFKKN